MLCAEWVLPEQDHGNNGDRQRAGDIPKPVRDFLSIKPGSLVDFKRAADGSIVLVPANDAKPESRFAKFRGHAGPGPSTDEIMELLRGEP